MLNIDDIVKVKYPKLFLSPDYAVYIELAMNQTSTCYFGVNYNLAVALRACHSFYMTNDRASADGGSVTGKTDGRVSMTFWNNTKAGDYSGLTLSTYGQELQALIRAQGPAASISNPYISLGC